MTYKQKSITKYCSTQHNRKRKKKFRIKPCPTHFNQKRELPYQL